MMDLRIMVAVVSSSASENCPQSNSDVIFIYFVLFDFYLLYQAENFKVFKKSLKQ